MSAFAVPREQRLAAYYAFLQILAEASSWQAASSRLLELIGEFFDFDVGALYLEHESGERLRWEDGWERNVAFAAFQAASRSASFERGVGLRGRVWDTGEPEWLDDVGNDPRFLRAPAAAEAGIGAAVVLPVIGTGGAIGAMEFFARERRALDAELLELMRTIGRQVGQYVVRARSEQQLRASQAMTAGIVEAALDCIITMDAQGHVVDFNPAAERTFGHSREDVRGRELAELIVPPGLREAHRKAVRRVMETGRGELLGRRLELDGLRADGTTFPVELTITQIDVAGTTLFAGFLRDISERRHTAVELEEAYGRERVARVRAEAAERRARHVARTLEQTVLPPALPVVEGLELAGAYRAGSKGTVVGGDFYDVFAVRGGQGWGCVIGDVCGKGLAAAAVTALARYTVRTAAGRERGAEAVLRTLNEALLHDDIAADFVTAAYASLQPSGDGVDVCLGVGGHPLPLVLRADGAVEAVGSPGQLLGALPDPHIEEQAHHLAPGDSLVLYTDGLTEARSGNERLGTERAAELLAQCRGLPVADIADRLVDVATADAEAHDDVAILVVRAR